MTSVKLCVPEGHGSVCLLLLIGYTGVPPVYPIRNSENNGLSVIHQLLVCYVSRLNRLSAGFGHSINGRTKRACGP